MSEKLGDGKFAGRDAPAMIGEAVPPSACVLDDRRPGARALVTGASSGIGRCFAEKLAAQGWNLTVVARDTARLESLKHQLEVAHGVNVRVLTADLTDRAQSRNVEAELASDGSLDLVINNAGVSYVGNLAESDADQMESMLEINSSAVMRLTRAALPPMLARGRGAIINVSSAGAFVCPPTSAVYCASKAFVNSFTEALSGELEGSGVQVQALCPGMTLTELHERGNFDVSWVASWMTPEQVVDASLAGLRLGEVVCVPGLQDPGLVLQMRAAGAGIVEQTINSIVADRYLAPSRA
jgi:short-subunit dehydrogenase